MTHYVVKIGFTTDNPLIACDVLSDFSNALEDIYEDRGLSGGAEVVIVPGETFTENDFDADREFDDNLNAYMAAGRNDNPLPEGFPTL